MSDYIERHRVMPRYIIYYYFHDATYYYIFIMLMPPMLRARHYFDAVSLTYAFTTDAAAWAFWCAPRYIIYAMPWRYASIIIIRWARASAAMPLFFMLPLFYHRACRFLMLELFVITIIIYAYMHVTCYFYSAPLRDINVRYYYWSALWAKRAVVHVWSSIYAMSARDDYDAIIMTLFFIIIICHYYILCRRHLLFLIITPRRWRHIIFIRLLFLMSPCRHEHTASSSTRAWYAYVMAPTAMRRCPPAHHP